MMPDWVTSFPGAVTVADNTMVIRYMNDKAIATWADKGGADLIGKDLLACHNPKSKEMIAKLLESGGTNSYTVEKKGVKKFIYQSAYLDEQGKVAGLVELSMVIPESLPHFVRG